MIQDFENIIKKFKASKLDKVFEKIGDNYKIIYNIEGLIYNNDYYPLIKLILWVDNTKQKLIENVITYLYSYNCEYKTITISDIKSNILEILEFIKNEKSNNELSNFIIKGTDKLNKELKNNKSNIFIQNIKYQDSGNLPCSKLQFNIDLISNDKTYNITLKYKNEWILNFNNNTQNISINDIEKILAEWLCN